MPHSRKGRKLGLSDSIALHEASFTGLVKVNREASLIPGVKILGLESPSKGRSYTADALKGAVGLYEGRKVFVDHQTKSAEPRSFRDLLGKFENVRFQEGSGLYGDLRYNPKHPEADSLVWWAENMPNGAGMSHDAFGKKSDKNGRQVIESITSVNSVDLVANPATNAGLFESTDAKEDDMNLATLTEAEIKTGNPSLHESIVNGATASLKTQVETLTAENKSLKEAKDALEVKDRLSAKKARAVELCKESKLPADLITPIFESQLLNAADESGMKALIEDRANLAPAPGNRPQSKEQRVAEGQGGGTGSGRITESVESFAAAIR